MIRKHQSKDDKTTYGVRIYRGDGRWEWIGSFPKLGAAHGNPALEARAAEHQAKTGATRRESMTCGEYAKRFLAEYARGRKQSSLDTATSSLKPFLNDFAHVPLDAITRIEAKDWAAKAKPSRVPVVVTLFNAAVEDELIERNPFRGLGQRTKGRSDERPPTGDELARLLAACSALKEYAPTMRALITFAAYTGLRPGELFALEWADVDFDAMRIQVRRRLYRGRLDTPKSNHPREVALTPPARDAILGLPRVDALVFHGKRGQRLSQSTLSGYWGKVLARAGLDFDFYLATKHYCAHYLWVVLGLPERAVAGQLGHALDRDMRWKLRSVYGHGEVGALEAIDAAFDRRVSPLRAVSDKRDAHGGPDAAS